MFAPASNKACAQSSNPSMQTACNGVLSYVFCQWKDGSCKPKSVAVHQDVVASWDEKKYGKNGVDLVVKYIQRWVKGAVGSTCDTTCVTFGFQKKQIHVFTID